MTSIKDYLLEFYIAQNGETITKELAEHLVKEFAITDGSDRASGEKYPIEQAREIGDKMGINWEEINLNHWYLMLNSIYSDYYPVFKKHGLTDWQIVAEMAKAWFDDPDGKENKTFKYFFA